MKHIMTHNKKTQPTDRAAYQKLCTVLRRSRQGFTVADMCAASALPLSQVKDLIPRAADEFSAQLSVTESGEIIYSFPHGFRSRYRGFWVSAARFCEKIITLLGATGAFLFKVWIMIMLIGYFTLFVVLALASVFISISGKSRNSGRSRKGGLSFGHGMFSMIWRLLVYSELSHSMTRSNRGRPLGRRKAAGQTRPLHRAIFSFVFGDGDSRKDTEAMYTRAVIAYIQSHKGVIAMPEYMAISGKSPADAEPALMAFCAEYGGSPEATEDGTIVYRFNELLVRSRTQDRSFADLSPPITGLQPFSANAKSMNICFSVINAVNLFFGSYYAVKALQTGALALSADSAISTLYEYTYAIFSYFSHNPLNLIGIALGLVPLAFSLLFWLIPAVRYAIVQKDNEAVRVENLKRLGFNHIWNNPLGVREKDIQSQISECKPKQFRGAQEKVVKDMGAYSTPDVSADASGELVYSFNELVREKEALKTYRSSITEEQLGAVIFDSGE
jgi:hypothetical protein